MSFRYALAQYIQPGDSNFGNQIIYQDNDFVLIRDSFPKSIVHWLLLPKSSKITATNPLTDAFVDREIKNKVINLVPKIKLMVLEEIERLGYEIIEKYQDNLIQVGVHAVPSMFNVHIHFITKDLSSECLKKKHHYNSFSTEFFVDFDELPLKAGDKRLNREEMEYHCCKDELVCRFCGEKFGNQFAKLKRHLQKEEFHNIYKKQSLPARKHIEIIVID